MSLSKLYLDISKNAFSRYESNLAILACGRPKALWLRHIYGGNKTNLFRLESAGSPAALDADARAVPGLLSLFDDNGSIEIIMPEPNSIRIRGSGMKLRLVGEGCRKWDLMIPAGDDRWRSIMGKAKLLFTPVSGTMKVEAPWKPTAGSEYRHHGTHPIHVVFGTDAEEWEVQINAYESEIDPPGIYESFKEARQRSEDSFAVWLNKTPPAPERYRLTRELAAYVTWSAVVPAAGNYRAPSMLMSKNGMVSTWNWDNYINAWASVYRDPDFAWGQFMLHISHQHKTGALGDGINEQSIGWSYTKPPVHGWILRRMAEASDAIDNVRIGEAYKPLCKWTEWWFQYRDDDRDGICQYHHGNDSGWDDATAFDIGSPNEAPDLNALLILQMEALGEFAGRLGKLDEATAWRKRSKEMLDRFIQHSWHEGRFAAMVSGSHAYDPDNQCLLSYIPLILGSRLPEDIRKAMMRDLTRQGGLLTEWGLASEAVDSPEYLSRGYWRGAIWPPPMLMSFGENHDALTGEIHYDPAYTWSASVFQIFAHLYLHDGRTTGLIF
ncbi:MAG: hypothetical protein LC725_05280 [Lentisphaerae bacterium]|nr:hypothetical protein [Lentisphaerota bacterium]